VEVTEKEIGDTIIALLFANQIRGGLKSNQRAE